MDYVYIDNSVDSKDELNDKLVEFNLTLHNNVKLGDHPECVDIVLGLMCHHSFPLCDYGSDIPQPRKVQILLQVIMTTIDRMNSVGL